VNWNWPGGLSVTVPSTVQLVNGSSRFVVVKTVTVFSLLFVVTVVVMFVV
jgi:hypothetical protein